MQPIKAINYLRSLTRWDHWYESKIPLFFILGYTLLFFHGQGLTNFLYYIRLILFSIFFLAFGYTINDISDREIDRLAGKPNPISAFPNTTAIGILSVLFLLGIIWLPLNNRVIMFFTILAYFFITAYSCPPIRFKERGILGLLVASAAQRTLPALVFFAAFNHWGLDALLFSVLFTLIGLRWIIGHQVWDLSNDLKTGVKTYASNVGLRHLNRLLAYLIFPGEIICLIALSVLYISSIPWLVILMFANFFWQGFVTLRRRRLGLQITLFSENWIPLADLYFIFWPLSLAIVLALISPLYWIVFTANLVWEHWFIWQQVLQLFLPYGKQRS